MFFYVLVPVQAARTNLFRGDVLEGKYFGLVPAAFNVLLARSNHTPHSPCHSDPFLVRNVVAKRGEFSQRVKRIKEPNAFIAPPTDVTALMSSLPRSGT
jgi:hypothetical protein